MQVFCVLFLFSINLALSSADSKSDERAMKLKIEERKKLYLAIKNKYKNYGIRDNHIELLIGENNTYILFDCETPQYLVLTDERQVYEMHKANYSAAQFNNSKHYTCKNDVWYFGHNIATENLLTRQLSVIINSKWGLALSKFGDLCEKLMELHHHPAFVHWKKQTLYNKSECDGVLNQEEEALYNKHNQKIIW
jgi:hypothetical protein